jgi:signal transduction histidine kinase
VEDASRSAVALADTPGAGAAEELRDVIADLGENLDKIVEHGHRIDGVVKSLAEHTRGTRGEPQELDFNPFLEGYIKIGEHGLRARYPALEQIEIALDLDPAIGAVRLVPAELSRVMINLLENAGYAVSTRRGKSGDAPSISVRTRDRGDRVEVRIRDNGGGIPAAVRDRIFSPFFTTKPTGQGTGLGLSISYDIVVKGHGGEIAFESEEGQFTEFVITLPKRHGHGG